MSYAGIVYRDNGPGLLRMAVADESERVLPTISALFEKDFQVTSIDLETLDREGEGGMPAPQVVLYLSKGAISTAVSFLERVRERWPKTIVLLLLPTVQNESQLKGASKLPVHNIIFKPCTKKKIVDAVDNYVSVLRSNDGSLFETGVLSCLIEFAGSQRPELYVAYNRVMPLIMGLCQQLDCDWRYVQKVCVGYLMFLSSIDRELVYPMMGCDSRKPSVVRDLYDQIAKMVDLMAMNPSTELMALDLKYMLKRYDGQGYPKDDVKEGGIPVASRMIRLLLDYHHLLQGGKSIGQALFIISSRKRWYDDTLVQSLVDMLGDEGKRYTRDVYPLGLVAGMVVAEDVYGIINGKRRKILSCNEILTDSAVDYLQRHSEDVLDITEPVKVVEELYSNNGDSHA